MDFFWDAGLRSLLLNTDEKFKTKFDSMEGNTMMTNIDDLLWLYKMALDYQLQPEKEWLKEHIQEQLNTFKKTSVPQSKLTELNEINGLDFISPLDTEKIAA